MRKITFLSSFFIKIFAIVFMTFDHVGLLLSMLYPDDLAIIGPYGLATIFRTFGRLALPLFAFMIVEGVIHTKNFKYYLIRLGVMAGLISLFFIVAEYSIFHSYAAPILRAGNIFLDLSLLAIVIYLLKQPNNLKKLFILLPLAYSILSFVVKCYETDTGYDLLWFPSFLTMQYDWVTICLGVGFFYSYKLSDIYISSFEKTSGLDKETWVLNGNYRLLVNIFSVFFIILVSFIYYMFTIIWPTGVFWDASTQIFAVFSGTFILLYNGHRGYNAKWFQYGSYLYYPLHILIIIIIYIVL